MKIAFGSDHAGFDSPGPHYKPEIAHHLEALGHTVIDCGTNSPESVDYPDFANAVCEAVLTKKADCGILMCGTGIGMSIAANRHHGIRAAVCVTPEMARLSKQHNHANVLCFGRRLLTLPQCIEIVDVWLTTEPDSSPRHERRVQKLG